jgi:hypothetical protein
MSKSSRHLELRLSIPADPMYRGVASDLAAKFAEYLGCARDRRAAIGSAAEKAVAQVADAAGADTHVELSLQATATALTISARNGSHHSKTTCQLSD